MKSKKSTRRFTSLKLDSDRYYLDATRRPKTYGIMAIDDGSAAEQVVAGCQADLQARCSRPGFREFLAAGPIRLTLVTATEERAAALGKCLQQQEWPCRLRTAVEVVSKLTYCLPKSQADRPEAWYPSAGWGWFGQSPRGCRGQRKLEQSNGKLFVRRWVAERC